MKLDEVEDSTADSCVLYPSKRKAEGFWPQVKEEINGKMVVNVGGTIFETSRQTLCLDSNSMLNAMISRHHSTSTMVWIDRDAERFRHVLNYLRNGTVWLDTVPSLRGLQEEAEYFGLEGLNSLCEDLIQGLEAKEEETSKRRYIQFCDAIREVFQNYDFPAVNICKDLSMLAAPTNRYMRCIEPVFQTDLDF